MFRSLGQPQRGARRRQWEGERAEWAEGGRLLSTGNHRASSSRPGASALTLTSCMFLCRPLRPRDLGLRRHATPTLQG